MNKKHIKTAVTCIDVNIFRMEGILKSCDLMGDKEAEEDYKEAIKACEKSKEYLLNL